MTVTEVLQLVDQIVLKHTGNHINDLQRKVIEGIWQGKTYSEIADDLGYSSENHVGNVSRELYKILSEELGENITKSNFGWTIERCANSFNSTPIMGISINNHFNWYSPNLNYDKNTINNQQEDIQKTSYINLSQFSNNLIFYGRNNEILALGQWIKNNHIHLISVLGLPGIGKSNLVRHFIDTHPIYYDAVIWKNINLYKSLNDILTEIAIELNVNIQDINASNLLKQCLQLFKQKRCLIILDNFEKIFSSQEFSGQYKPEHQDYKTFMQMVTEIEHQSCFILISQEKCQEMISLDNELYPSRCLELSGLDNVATQILHSQDLKDEDYWLELINLYEGHPKYLQYISILIKDVFYGAVSEFIKENCLIITEDLKSMLDSVWLRLSNVEKEILLEIGQHNKSISRDDIKQLLSLSSTDVINGLQSLSRRFLITKLEGSEKLFNLSPVFKEYLRLYQSVPDKSTS